MAEFAIATGLFGVASAGITLTKTLHDLGTTAWEAGEQTDFLSRSISHHCRALKELGRQLKIDHADHSAEALDTARELEEQTRLVLAKIKKLLPSPGRDCDGLSLKQKLIWGLRKSRVKHLVGQLEYLKTTVTLLRHILSTVPNLREFRRSQTATNDLRAEIREELTEAQNLIYERCRAQQDLPELAADDEADEVLTIGPPEVRSSSPTPPYSLEDMAPHPGNFLAEIDAYANELAPSDSRAMVMHKTSLWLAQLYGRWTTLSDDATPTQVPLGEEEVAYLAAPAAEGSEVSDASSGRESPPLRTTRMVPEKPPATDPTPRPRNMFTSAPHTWGNSLPSKTVPASANILDSQSGVDSKYTEVTNHPEYGTSEAQNKVDVDFHSSEPDVLFLRHKDHYVQLNFEAYAISEGKVSVGDLRLKAAANWGIYPWHVELWYKRQPLDNDLDPAVKYGVKMNSTVTLVAICQPYIL